MKLLYLLERSTREIEVFIRREIMEAMRQGVTVEAGHPEAGGYRIERSEEILALEPAQGDPPHSGSAVPPAPAALAMASGAAMSPSGAIRAARHALDAGAGLGSGFRQAVSLARYARKSGADLLHAHFAARAAEDAMLASWISGVPFTFTAHGYDVHLEPPRDLTVRARSAAAVVTVSRDNARVLTESLGVPRERLHVIPLGVDTDRFKPGPPEGEEPGLVVSVLRLHPDKGPDILIEAARLLLERGLEFRVEILGEGGERASLAARLAGPLGARVKLMGAAPEESVLSTLRRASLFVVPSRRESLGVALMEAMACGKAVVASNVGGVPEVTDGDRCALLVPPEDPLALAEAIAALLLDPRRRRDLGLAARARVLDAFRLDQSVARLRRLWEEAVAHRGMPAMRAPDGP